MLFYRRRDLSTACLAALQHYDEAVRAQVRGRIQTPLRMRDWELCQVLARLDSLAPESRILDTGSFNTYLPLFLRKNFQHVVASDLLAARRRKSWLRKLKLAPPKATEAPFSDWVNVMTDGGVGLRELDLTRIDEPDNAFDLVISISVIEHIPEIEKAIAELFRVTRPGGRLLISTDCSPQSVPYRDGVRYFSRDELRALFAPYTEITNDEAPDFAEENWCYGGKNGPVVTGFIEIAKPA